MERVSPTAKVFLELRKQVGGNPGAVCTGLVKERLIFDEWRKVTKRDEDFDVYLPVGGLEPYMQIRAVKEETREEELYASMRSVQPVV